MTIRVRDITSKESETLAHWQRCDDVVGYRRARILRLSERGWQCADIADVLGVHVETVRELIKNFNEGGIDAIAPRPRSGGR
jgi:transposase